MREALQQARPATSSYELACKERGILPKYARVAQAGCLGGALDLRGVGLGDLQLEALLCDSALVPTAEVQCWRLADTRIRARGIAVLSRRLPWQTEIVDLSRNELGSRGCELLAARLGEGRLPRLRSLDLSGVGMGCAAAGALCSALCQCPVLQRLELCNNSIQDGTALGAMVAEHNQLMRLGLSNNYLTGKDAAALFSGVLGNSRSGGRLSDLDLAWNAMGRSNGRLAAEAISAVLAESTTLYHLDLSYARLPAACCALIGEGLKDNHDLYGLHLVGNAATMDADGFVQPLLQASAPTGGQQAAPGPSAGTLLTGDLQSMASSCLATGGGAAMHKAARPRRCVRSGPCPAQPPTERTAEMSAEGDDSNELGALRERDVLEQRSMCWACEGWTLLELTWRSPPGEPEPRAVWAFTSLDGFRSALRLRRAAEEAATEGQGLFSAARMVPGGSSLLVVFQVDSALRVAPELEAEALSRPVSIELRTCEELPSVEPPAGSPGLSVGEGEAPQRIVHTCQQATCIRCPVVADAGAVAASFQGRRAVLMDGPDGRPVQMLRVTESEFRRHLKCPTSAKFFEGFQKETDKLVHACLETDWSRAKVGRIVDEAEHQATLDVLRGHYRGIIATYRLLSCCGSTSENTAFGVNQIELADFASQAGLVDGKVTRIADIDRLFISSKVMNVEMKRGLAIRNDRALVRHQFLEFLLRLADQRFVQTGEVASISQALTLVLQALSTASERRVAELDSFITALHTEAMDEVYTRHLGVVQGAYRRNSGRQTLPGAPAFMSFSEFQDLIDRLGVYSSVFPRARVGLAFRLGMMTQSEENYSMRFQEMSLLEFQHALGAVVYLTAAGITEQFPALADAFLRGPLANSLRV